MRSDARHSADRTGFVLAAVLVVVALGAMTAAALLYRAQAEVAAVAAHAQQEQALAAADSGLHAALDILAQAPTDPSQWRDNPDRFRHVPVAEDGARRWFFTIYAPADANAGSSAAEDDVRFGLTDESGKINVNFASAQTLAALPGMTSEMVDALLDFRDADNEPRPQGAEQDFYDRLPHPYRIPNRALATIEELLLVRGFSGVEVYGEDANLNGRLDPNEDDGDASFPPDNRDGQLDPGLQAYLTPFNFSPNVDSRGQRRVNINGPVNALNDLGLSSELVEFIRLVRADGRQFSHPAELLNLTHVLERPSRNPDHPAGYELVSPLDAVDLPIVCDRLTARPQPFIVDTVNINAAPQAVLMTLPNVDENLALRIISARATLDPETASTIAWLYTEGLVEADAFQQIAPRIHALGFQYRVRCVGWSAPGGQYRSIEAVVDLAQGMRRGDRRPRILYYRDLTALGAPLPLNADDLELGR